MTDQQDDTHVCDRQCRVVTVHRCPCGAVMETQWPVAHLGREESRESGVWLRERVHEWTEKHGECSAQYRRLVEHQCATLAAVTEATRKEAS